MPIIPFILTTALIFALSSIITVVILNKKLIRARNDVVMLVTKQLVNKLNGLFDIQYSSKSEKVHFTKLPLSKDEDKQPLDTFTDNVSIKPEVKNETTEYLVPLYPVRSETETNNNKGTNIDPDFLHRVTSIIYREITNTENLIEVISSELCMSSSQLNRRIKLMTGMTTSHFILVIKLNRAKKQLTLTQKPIGEIAVECGFNDFAYFSRSFKKEFEMTPTTFQRIAH